MRTKSIWCDECKLKVFECQHLDGRNADPEVPDDLPRDPEKRQLTFLAFNAVIPAHAIHVITVNPQIDFKPRRLVVDPKIADAFMIWDIKIGVMSQFGADSGGGVSTAVFPPMPPKYHPHANLEGLPMVMPGQQMSLCLRNRDVSYHEFNALVWGDTPVYDARDFSGAELVQALTDKRAKLRRR